MSEVSGAEAFSGCLMGLVVLIGLGAIIGVIVLVFTILYYAALALVGILTLVLGLLVIYGIFRLFVWLAREYPDVLAWIIVATCVALSVWGVWSLWSWLWHVHRSMMLWSLTGVGVFSSVYLAIEFVRSLRERIREDRKQQEFDRQEKERAQQDAEEARRQSWLSGADLYSALVSQKDQLVRRIRQLNASKASVATLEESIRSCRESGNPADTLGLYMKDVVRERSNVSALMNDVARLWAQSVLLEQTIPFTVLLRSISNLSGYTQCSIEQNPAQAARMYVQLRKELESVCNGMEVELCASSRIQELQPPIDGIYPLVESLLLAAHELFHNSIRKHLRTLEIQIERLYYLEGAAKRALLHQEIGDGIEPTCSFSDVAEAMAEALTELGRVIDQTNQQMADAETQGVEPPLTPRLVSVDDFVDPLDELARARMRLAAKRGKQTT